eukprot:767912-Hanusia_phi.AAC.9
MEMMEISVMVDIDEGNDVLKVAISKVKNVCKHIQVVDTFGRMSKKLSHLNFTPSDLHSHRLTILTPSQHQEDVFVA